LSFRGRLLWSEPSSGPARSHGPRFPASANPHGVRSRFRAFVGKRSSEGIGCFAPGLRLPWALACCAVRFPVFLHFPYRLARPGRHSLLRLRSPSGPPLASSAGHLSMPAPLLGISCRSAHPFRGSPLVPEAPPSGMFRVQGFSPSARLPPPTASRVCFTPQTPFGFTLQGVPLPRSRDGSSPPPCRPAVRPRLRSRLLVWRDQRRTTHHP